MDQIQAMEIEYRQALHHLLLGSIEILWKVQSYFGLAIILKTVLGGCVNSVRIDAQVWKDLANKIEHMIKIWL